MKNKKVFLGWFLSYLIMMGLIILMSIMLYFYSYHIISSQSVQINRSMLEKVQLELDGYFTDARAGLAALMLDTDVQKAINVKREFSLGERELLSDIYTHIINRCASTKVLSHMFIYFSQGDTVISDEGHMDSKLYYDLYYQQQGMDKDGFVSWLNREWIGDVQMLMNSRGEKDILVLQNSIPRGGMQSAATLAVSINESVFRKGMEAHQWDGSLELLMVSDNGKVIGNDALMDAVGDTSGWVAEILDGRTRMDIRGEHYNIITIPSSEQFLTYVALAPAQAAQQSARKIQIFMLAGLSACILLGTVTAYAFANFHYRPLRYIMDLFGNYDKDGSAVQQDEFQWLTRQTVHVIDQHKDMSHHYQNNQKKLAGQYLYRLLTLPYDGEGKYARYFRQEQLLQKPYNLVILFCFEQEALERLWRKDFDEELLQFIIVNIMCELAQERFAVEMVDVQDAAACIIVNADRMDPEIREDLEKIFEQLQKFIESKIKCELSIVCGSFNGGPEGVYQSYLTAREALEYLEKNEDLSVVWYEDIQNPYCLFDYNLEMEQRIINTIKAGDGPNACNWAGQVIHKAYVQKEMLPSVRKCFLFDLLGTVLKGAQQGGSEEMIPGIVDGQELFRRMGEDEAREYFTDIITKLCNEIRQKEMDNRSDKQFGRRVMEFVQEHYQDPDLNVSITALHFGLTPSYLSSLFKQQTNLSLLEYINNIRIEKVKELLEDGKNLTEICSLTGFRSSGALIRVFKKGIGITPGQMKKLGENDMDGQKKG